MVMMGVDLELVISIFGLDVAGWATKGGYTNASDNWRSAVVK